jgi:hypothetical protein
MWRGRHRRIQHSSFRKICVWEGATAAVVASFLLSTLSFLPFSFPSFIHYFIAPLDMASASRLPLKSLAFTTTLVLALGISRTNILNVLLNTFTGPGRYRRIAVTVILLANLKNLPFGWHVSFMAFQFLFGGTSNLTNSFGCLTRLQNTVFFLNASSPLSWLRRPCFSPL